MNHVVHVLPLRLLPLARWFFFAAASSPAARPVDRLRRFVSCRSPGRSPAAASSPAARPDDRLRPLRLLPTARPDDRRPSHPMDDGRRARPNPADAPPPRDAFPLVLLHEAPDPPDALAPPVALAPPDVLTPQPDGVRRLLPDVDSPCDVSSTADATLPNWGAVALLRTLLHNAPPPAVLPDVVPPAMLSYANRSNSEVAEPIPRVDWDNLQIVETHDEEGRIELLSEDQIYVLLGLRDERGTVAASNDCGMVEESVDNDDATIPISDDIPNELVISYDKDHPVMNIGTIYPSMDEFRMAVRQFAINEEFALGTEKSDKKRFRGFCKSSDDCPWKINASKHKGQSTVEVTALTDQHTCVSTMRVKTITPSQKWVASKVVSILRDSPNMGPKEL